MSEPILLYNAIRTPDGTVLVSRTVHDYKTHIDKVSGEEYMVDGGLDYIRRTTGHKVPYTELSVYSDALFDTIRDSFEWGSRGKDGTEPLRYIKLRYLSADHIVAILNTQRHIPYNIRDVFLKELGYRVAEELIS